MFFQSKYTRHSISSSRWFYCLFCRFLVFFFRRRLRMSSFFSYPKQARRRRRGRKSGCRLFVTYFYRRLFFRPIRPWHFMSYRGVSQFLLSLYPFSLLILLEDFWGDQAKRQQRSQLLFYSFSISSSSSSSFGVPVRASLISQGHPQRNFFRQEKGVKQQINLPLARQAVGIRS